MAELSKTSLNFTNFTHFTPDTYQVTTLLARSSSFPVIDRCSSSKLAAIKSAALKSACVKYSPVGKYIFSQSPNRQVEVYVEVSGQVHQETLGQVHQEPGGGQVEVEVHQRHCDTSELGQDLDLARFDAVKSGPSMEKRAGAVLHERAEADAVLRFLSKRRAPTAALRRTLEISSASKVFGPYIQPPN